ncbi:MAG: hypothetical protein AAB019_09145 [Planctomycetota bacterium]
MKKAGWFLGMTLVWLLGFGIWNLSEVRANISPGGAGNYTYLDNVTTADTTYSWIDISAGTVITSYGSAANVNGVYNVNLPFTFNFYGTGYTSVNVSENGYLRFAAGNDYEVNQVAVPSSLSPTGGCVFVMHDDLGGLAGGWMRYQNFGTTPNQYTVIEWFNMYTVLRGAYNTVFEVILYESGAIKCQYADTFLYATGGCYSVNYYAHESGTTGIENSDGTVGRGYIINSNANYDGRAVLFAPAEQYVSSLTYGSEVQGGVAIKRGETVAMEKFTLNLEVGSKAWNTIKVTKTGTAPDSAVEEVSLYQDTNGNGKWDLVGDTKKGFGTFTSGTVTITLTNATLDTTARTYFIAYKLAPVIPGGVTLGAKIVSVGDLTGNSTLFVKDGSF